MNPTGTYLAVFVGDMKSKSFEAWKALSEAQRREKEQKGMAAWKAWAEKHKASIVEMGGPLGKTKSISSGGVKDISNHLGGFTVVRAASHEAAAKMFENHPHFAIFPGDAVELMPVMSVPGA